MEVDVVTDETAVPTPSKGKVEMYVLERDVIGPRAIKVRLLKVKSSDGATEVVARLAPKISPA